MGKLSDAIKEYKISPIGSPAEREAEIDKLLNKTNSLIESGGKLIWV